MPTKALGTSAVRERLAAFCRKWDVSRLERFVSDRQRAARQRHHLLVTFAAGVCSTAYMLLDMGDELDVLFGRRVDLVPRDAIEHGPRADVRTEILQTARVVYGRCTESDYHAAA